MIIGFKVKIEFLSFLEKVLAEIEKRKRQEFEFERKVDLITYQSENR